ncbi:AEC family transporter [Thiofilum flexile]|uniref:AEC family transporter n=1 Tax=Thiofilum flexile TaxID=125627 RepID=UPI000381D0A1|nr:AEC family transporter [Thiofilum flexile]
MSASFLAGLNAIIPLFILIGLGYLAKRTVLDSKMLPALNSFVYYFAVPALLFNAARQQNLEHLLHLSGLGLFSLAALITGLIAVAGCYNLFHIRGFTNLVQRGLAATFANFAYMGIPLIMSVLGNKAHGALIAIILMGNLVLIAGSQLLIEAHAQGAMSIRAVGAILDRALLRNPIFVATILGVLCSAGQVPIPAGIEAALEMLAPAAIPVALFCLGAGLQWRNTQVNKGELAWLILVKLVLHPGITYLCFWLVGVEDHTWLLTTVLLTALPTGALAHVVALKYNTFSHETAQIVALSTLFSLISVALWTALLL